MNFEPNKSDINNNNKDTYVEPGKWVGPPDENGIQATEEFHKSAFDDDDDETQKNS